MRLILDATPLIHLTKAGFHIYFDKLDVELVTTGEVLKEVLIEDFPENDAIKKLVDSEKIKIENPRQIKSWIKGAHAGEVSVVSLAVETKSTAIIDDELGRTYARGLGIEVFHSTFLIIRAVAKGIINKRDAVKFIDRMPFTPDGTSTVMSPK